MRNIASIDISASRHDASYPLGPDDRVDAILLLYSGGLDTSCLVHWIKSKFKCKLIALTVNVGQQRDNFDEIRSRALQLGADEHILIDGRSRLIEQYAYFAVKANGRIGAHGHPLSSSLTRPLIAEMAVELVEERGITCVAHGATGRSNDNVRFDTALLSLNSKIKILAPVREWGFTREEEIQYLNSFGVNLFDADEPSYSVDDNVWGIELEAGIITDHEKPFPTEHRRLVNDLNAAPHHPETVDVEFYEGEATAINGKLLSPLQIVEELNLKGAEHGIGFFDHLEDRALGFKVREIHECPAAEILMRIYADMEYASLNLESLQLKSYLDREWVHSTMFGKCFSEPFDTIRLAIDRLSKKVGGKAQVRLFKGSCQIVSRNYTNALDIEAFKKALGPDWLLSERAMTSYIQISSNRLLFGRSGR